MPRNQRLEIAATILAGMMTRPDRFIPDPGNDEGWNEYRQRVVADALAWTDSLIDLEEHTR